MSKHRERRPNPIPLRALVWTLALGGAAHAAPASAQSQWDVLFHGTRISYEESQVKDAGTVLGFYGTYGTGYRHLVEVGATRTGIDYLDGVRLEQTDAALAYSLYGTHGAGRLGVHIISSTDPLTDGGILLFGGASRYRVGVWSVGAEGVWSSYPDYDGGLEALQVAPSLGFTVHAGGDRALGATVRSYLIHLSREMGLGDTDFVSLEATVVYTAGPVTLSGFAWGGEQAFAVRSGGFLAYNLAERHTGGYGGGVRWVMTPRSALSAGLYIERFEDMEVLGEAWARTLSVSLGFTL